MNITKIKPKPTKAKKVNYIGLKVDDSLLSLITEEAQSEERSVSAQIRSILIRHYNNKTNN
jgi:hypothetical protein